VLNDFLIDGTLEVRNEFLKLHVSLLWHFYNNKVPDNAEKTL